MSKKSPTKPQSPQSPLPAANKPSAGSNPMAKARTATTKDAPAKKPLVTAKSVKASTTSKAPGIGQNAAGGATNDSKPTTTTGRTTRPAYLRKPVALVENPPSGSQRLPGSSSNATGSTRPTARGPTATRTAGAAAPANMKPSSNINNKATATTVGPRPAGARPASGARPTSAGPNAPSSASARSATTRPTNPTVGAGTVKPRIATTIRLSKPAAAQAAASARLATGRSTAGSNGANVPAARSRPATAGATSGPSGAIGVSKKPTGSGKLPGDKILQAPRNNKKVKGEINPFTQTCEKRCGGSSPSKAPTKKPGTGGKKRVASGGASGSGAGGNKPNTPGEKKPNEGAEKKKVVAATPEKRPMDDFKDPFVNKLMKDEIMSNRDRTPVQAPPKPKPYYPLVPRPTQRDSAFNNYVPTALTESEKDAEDVRKVEEQRKLALAKKVKKKKEEPVSTKVELIHDETGSDDESNGDPPEQTGAFGFDFEGRDEMYRMNEKDLFRGRVELASKNEEEPPNFDPPM